jgi:hypothetical protein
MCYPQFWTIELLIVTLMFVINAWADYVMDDHNTTIQYHGSWSPSYSGGGGAVEAVWRALSSKKQALTGSQ